MHLHNQIHALRELNVHKHQWLFVGELRPFKFLKLIEIDFGYGGKA